MVQSQAQTVEAYIAEASPGRAPDLERIREIARHVLKGYDERMQWGMPVYLRDGKAEFAFANQKQYLALYVMKTGVHARNAEALSGLDCGKGCIRFHRPEAIDWALVEKLLTDTRDSDQAPC
jgi:uncharacterized protein YdhG (YjbR/CyaY superfamily)